MTDTDNPLDGLRSELAKVLHLNGCQQRTAGYNDHIDKKDIDTDDMERLEALTLDEVMTEVSLYCHKQVIEARIKTLRDLPDVRMGGDDAQWFEDYLWKEIEKLEAELRKTL